MRRDGYLYQVRMGRGQTAGDLVHELVHAVWDVLSKAPEEKALDPHRWPNLHGLFQDVFRGRMVHYAGCGEREECRTCLASATDGSPFPAEEWSGGTPVFTLEFGRDLGRLSRLLAALACRRFRPVPPETARGLIDRVAEAVRKIFEGRVYRSAACAACDARKGFREKRLWPKDVLKRSVS
jgi:hypothetical protein